MADLILRADAFRLPFRDGSFDVVVADPPYEVSNPKSAHLVRRTAKQGAAGRKRLAEVGYIEFRSRKWWHEAWRLLSPRGHLYVAAVIKELPAWLTGDFPPPAGILAWVVPNAAGVQNKIRRAIGGRSLAWRPILHWRKGADISWRLPGGLGGAAGFVEPNYLVASQVQANMAEAEPWPNQLPLALLRWLLRPHWRARRVLDLFSGTGTTRVACLELGLSVVSVDLSPEALEIVRRRPVQIGIGL